ncbi:beta-aspartyl-peptidase [Desulfopila sp. IMCC35006]|uniref:beta-aspartyl-peptidase n=1 Tax=Desulfopila sp. IMCC35006 TaxID=2569542 RepID=UPI0010AC37B4|nr:beta-aspartyl-peptidase [Desulfopila sp. IMCC35006]TKB26207.1 beta-aspartyl-peptidase [Desulfopila sp. IMCC35006]
MILIQNGDIYTPSALGRGDVLIGGGRILHIAEHIDPASLPGKNDLIDAKGMAVTPGFIDGHQHFTGGGGEGGFHTRTPEMQLSMNFDNGVTTAVGLLGTDSLTRSVESLYAKTEAFNNEGMTAFMLTGAYWHPSPTVTGSIGRDLTYLRPVIGLKLALADTRGPLLTAEDLAAMAAEIRVAALVAGKPGIMTIHTGIKEERLQLLFMVIKKYGIRADTFIPTHVNRKDLLLQEQVFQLAEMGATADATCLTEMPTEQDNYLSAADFAVLADNRGLFDRITFSSDAGGSMPRWDKERKHIVGMGIDTPVSLCFELNRLVNTLHMNLEKALKPLTTTPARLYGLQGRKGVIAAGADGDVLILDPSAMRIVDVVAGGAIVKRDGCLLKKGYFEQG